MKSFDHKLILGDASEEVAKLPSKSFNLVVTDPPYLAPSESYVSRDPEWGKRHYADLSALTGFLKPIFRECDRVLNDDGHLLVFCDPVSYPLMFQASYDLFDRVRCLVWWKGKHYFSLGQGAWRYSFELILHARRTAAWFDKHDRQDIIENPPVNNGDRHHPAEKPVRLLQNLIKAASPKGGAVLDPFMGSGSTIVACEREGMIGTGIELDEAYFRIAEKRLSHAKAQANFDHMLGVEGKA